MYVWAYVLSVCVYACTCVCVQESSVPEEERLAYVPMQRSSHAEATADVFLEVCRVVWGGVCMYVGVSVSVCAFVRMCMGVCLAACAYMRDRA